jgi:catechol 2,3-dioxygenase-like lactoylglutathione lyase family enzyme
MTILHHAGICVADIDEALRFYRDGVGLDVLVDKVIEADLESLLGVHTRRVRTVFLGSADHPDGGIVELLDLGLKNIADATAQTGLPNRGLFLLSFQVDVPGVLARLDALGLGGAPRTMPIPRGGLAATVVDPDGVMVELLPAGRGVLS